MIRKELNNYLRIQLLLQLLTTSPKEAEILLIEYITLYLEGLNKEKSFKYTNEKFLNQIIARIENQSFKLSDTTEYRQEKQNGLRQLFKVMEDLEMVLSKIKWGEKRYDG